MLRGNHREALFATDHDRQVLNQIVAEGIARCRALIHAFCWMTNHLHLLVQISDVPLGKLMQRIAMRFSRHRHKTLATTGHLFDGRYKALLVDVDSYFLDLLRYIHLNPVDARIVDHPSDYPWSSHIAYLGATSIGWLTTEFGLGLFGPTPATAIPAYQRFIANALHLPVSNPTLDSHVDDPRILGADRFVNNLPSPIFRPRRRITLVQLAEQVCGQHGIEVSQLCSPLRQRRLSVIRVQFAQHALAGRVATLHQIAQFLGRDDSSLCKLIARHTKSPISQD